MFKVKDVGLFFYFIGKDIEIWMVSIMCNVIY